MVIIAQPAHNLTINPTRLRSFRWRLSVEDLEASISHWSCLFHIFFDFLVKIQSGMQLPSLKKVPLLDSFQTLGTLSAIALKIPACILIRKVKEMRLERNGKYKTSVYFERAQIPTFSL